MLTRTPSVGSAKLALRPFLYAGAVPVRTFASSSAGPTSSAYETADVAGIKTAVRDHHGPTTKLAIVAKAGTRYQPLPGLSAGLEAFAFKNTQKRSALRITRESELLGGQLTAYHTREALVVEASFLRNDLPYFAELLAEVAAETKYTTHEFHEEVESVIRLKQRSINANATALAVDAAHSVAFHGGLGQPLYPSPSTPTKAYLNEQNIADFAGTAYAKPNIAVVAEGAASATFARWTEQFFKGLPTASVSTLALHSSASKYYGGEHRSALPAGNALVIAFQGTSYASPASELAVLAALIGGTPSIKWSPGFTVLSRATAANQGLSAQVQNLAYSDAGLLTIQLSGPAASVRQAAEETSKALKSISEGSVSKEDLAKAIAKAKFDALEASQSRDTALLLAGAGLLHNGKPYDLASQTKQIEGVTIEKLKTATKALLDGKASVAAVGDLHVLPFAEELGLRV